MILFEINAISEQYISVSLENPHQESLETVEFDLSDCCNVVCKLFSNNKTQDAAIADHLSRCIQKTFSIPVTLRALLKYWERENVKAHQPFEDGGREPGGGGGSRLASGSNTKYIKSDQNGVTGGGGSSNARIFHANGGGGGTIDGVGSSSSGDTNFLNQLPSDIQMSLTGSNASDSIDKPIKRRRLTGEDFWKNPKSSKTDEFDIGSDSNSSLGGKSAADKSVGVQQQQQQPQSGGGGISEFEMFVEGKKKVEGGDATDDDVELDFETGEIFRQQQKKLPNVSITAINVAGLERRPGIEIIPITSTSQNLPSSITITPINVGGTSKSEKKTSSSGGSSSSSKKHDDRNRLEKKKKRKRDDSPAMGPPEKIPTKQELLANKPISLSINPLSTAAAGLIRKYSSSSPTALSTSPKHQSTFSVSGGSSSSGSIKSSPKHSPVHSQASNSPKHGISSPKHPSSGGGKPSVTTLKSLNSPKSSEKSSSSSFSKDREKKSSSSSGGSSPKISKSSSSSSSSSAKIKLLDDVGGQALQLLSGGIDEKSINLTGSLLTSGISKNTSV
jgi:mediator of RNA polymerase II transcription subunit 1